MNENERLEGQEQKELKKLKELKGQGAEEGAELSLRIMEEYLLS